jgi:NADH dehydrogenase (ubiquinone) Fe-S protein 1
VLVKMRSQLLRAAARSKGTATVARTRQFSSSARRSAEVELTIDGKKVSIEAGSALIQACEKAGVTIPRYCYHEYASYIKRYPSILIFAAESY